MYTDVLYWCIDCTRFTSLHILHRCRNDDSWFLLNGGWMPVVFPNITYWESGLCEPCIQQAPASNRKTQEVQSWTWKVSRNQWIVVTFVWYFDGDVVWSLFGWAKETLWENILLMHFRFGQFCNGGIWRLRRVGCIIALMLFPLQPYTAISLKKVSLAKILHRFLRRKPCFRFQIIRHDRKISWFIPTLRAETAIENSEFLQTPLGKFCSDILWFKMMSL